LEGFFIQLFRGLRAGSKGTLVDVDDVFLLCFRFDFDFLETDFLELIEGDSLWERADFLDESLHDVSVDADTRLEQESGPRIE